VKWKVIGKEDLRVWSILGPNNLVAAQGSVDLELQHGEVDVLKESVQFGVPRTGPWL